MTRTQAPRPLSRRRGAATVEMALVLPVLFLVLFGAIEFGRVNMLRNSLKNACFEGARAGSLPGATADDVLRATRQALSAVNVKNPEIEVLPTVIDDTTKSVIVSVNAPIEGNVWGSTWFFRGESLQRVCRLNREYVNPEYDSAVDPLIALEEKLAADIDGDTESELEEAFPAESAALTKAIDDAAASGLSVSGSSGSDSSGKDSSGKDSSSDDSSDDDSSGKGSSGKG